MNDRDRIILHLAHFHRVQLLTLERFDDVELRRMHEAEHSDGHLDRHHLHEADGSLAAGISP